MKMVQVRNFWFPNFFQYRMADTRKIIEQFHDVIHVCNQFAQHEIHMDESIVVSFVLKNFLIQ